MTASTIKNITATILIYGLFINLLSLENLYACNYSSDPEMAKAKQKCESDSSKRWECSLNRCVNTKESEATNLDFKACAKLADQRARDKCHKDLAKQQTGELSTDKPSSGLAQGVYALTIGLAALNFFSKQKPKATCTSRTIFTAAAVASLGAEAYFFFMVDKKLKNLSKEYKEDSDPYEMQMNAFQYLKNEQETIADAAGKKKNVYLGLTALYGAAMAFALYEAAYPGANKCEMSIEKSASENAESSTQIYFQNDLEISRSFKKQIIESSSIADSIMLYKEFENFTTGQELFSTNKEYNNIKKWNNSQSLQELKSTKSLLTLSIDFLLPKAYAKEEKEKKDYGFYKMAIGAAGVAVIGSQFDTSSKYFRSSWGVAAVSAIAAGISYKLYSGYKEQAEQAKKNAEDVQTIIDKFQETVAMHCPKGRESLTEPKCYCYNENGTKNQGRSNSNTCQALWNKDQYKMATLGDYTKKVDTTKLGCMTQAGDFDQECKCRKFVNSKGSNACYKTYLGNMGGLGGQTNIPSLIADTNQMTQGNYSPSNGLINGGAGKFAAKNKKIANRLLKDFNKGKKTPLKLGTKLTNDYMNRVGKALSTNFGDRGFLGSGGFSTKSGRAEMGKGKAGEALKKALEKTKLNKVKYKSGKDKRNGRKKGDDFAFNFNDSESSSSKKGKVQQFMDKKYNYKDNDINNKKSIPIWKIISNRYNQTGLKRLFDE